MKRFLSILVLIGLGFTSVGCAGNSVSTVRTNPKKTMGLPQGEWMFVRHEGSSWVAPQTSVTLVYELVADPATKEKTWRLVGTVTGSSAGFLTSAFQGSAAGGAIGAGIGSAGASRLTASSTGGDANATAIAP